MLAAGVRLSPRSPPAPVFRGHGSNARSGRPVAPATACPTLAEDHPMTTRIPYTSCALLDAIFRRHGWSRPRRRVAGLQHWRAERDGAYTTVSSHQGNLGSLDSGCSTARLCPCSRMSPPACCASMAATASRAALELARQPLMDKARANGIALLAVRKAHHFAPCGPYRPFARD